MSLINDVVLKQAITDTVTSLASHIVEYEPYTDDEIAELFNLTPEEVQRVTDIISDTVISQYKLWSSKKVNDEISAAKEECNTYAEELAAKIATMSTTYTDSLPAMGSSNIIYVLKETAGDGTVSHTINLWNPDVSDYVKCGSIEQALSNLYTKEQIDTKLADYALKSEVFTQDDLVTVISDKSTASHDKVPTELSIANALSDVVKVSTETGNIIEEKSDGLYASSTEKEISWVDYQSLSEEEKNNGTTYYIPDMPVSSNGEIISEVEYGSFFGNDISGDLLSVGSIIDFSNKTRGNLTYDNGIKLTKGKLYLINCNIASASATANITNSHIRFDIRINGNQIYVTNGISIPTDSTSKWTNAELVTHYECKNDGEILTVNVVSVENIYNTIGGMSHLIITEIPNLQACIDVTDDHIKEVINGNLNNKVDKTQIVTSVSSTSTNEEVASAKVTNSVKTTANDALSKINTHLTNPYQYVEVNYDREAISAESYIQQVIPYTVPDGYCIINFMIAHTGHKGVYTFGQYTSALTGTVNLTIFFANCETYDMPVATGLTLHVFLAKL